MEQTDKLALRIYKGTRILGLDEYPLVAVGTVPHSFQPRTPSLVNEPEVWMLMHAQDYTLYSYIVTNDDLDRIILISLFVPADMRLTADDSPHDLLSKAFESFKTQCNKNSIDTMPFEQLLARCVLEERPDEIHLPVMGGINPASFCADSKAQVNALLRFSHYQQLSNISRLEIGYQCDTTITIPIKAGQKPKPLQEHKTIDQHKEPTKNQSLKQDSNIDIDTKPKKKYYQKGYFYFFIVIAFFVVAFFCKGIYSKQIQARLEADSISRADLIAAIKKAQEEAAKKAQEAAAAKKAQAEATAMKAQAKAAAKRAQAEATAMKAQAKAAAKRAQAEADAKKAQAEANAKKAQAEATAMKAQAKAAAKRAQAEANAKRAQAEADAKKAQAEAAAKRAQAEADAKKAKEVTKAEILKLVNEKNLTACRNHPGWYTQLTKTERHAVEAVLNMEQYNASVKIMIKGYLEKKSFKNWNELLVEKIMIDAITEMCK